MVATMARKAKKTLKVNLDSLLNVTMAINHLESRRRELELENQRKKDLKRYCYKVTVPGSILENSNTGTTYVVESVEEKELDVPYFIHKTQPSIKIRVATLRSKNSGYRKQITLHKNLFTAKFKLVATPKAAHALYGQGFKSEEVILL